MPTPQTVFITGASSGLGQALACHYARQGAVLGLAARRGDALQALAATLGGTIHCYPLDVTDATALQAAGRDFMARAGVPDIVIANAGISVGTLTEEADDIVAFARVFDVNVMGAVHTFQPFAAAMRDAGRGRLVGIASVAGVRGLPGAGAYSASKAALRTYLEALRVEMRDSGLVLMLAAFVMTAINPYAMPFLLPADEAARRIARVIAAGRAQAVVPWQMGLVATLMKWLPTGLYDRLAAKAGRKPRHLPL